MAAAVPAALLPCASAELNTILKAPKTLFWLVSPAADSCVHSSLRSHALISRCKTNETVLESAISNFLNSNSERGRVHTGASPVICDSKL
ncbi:hypothetical protein EVAR_61020_1 [Eumeta japonica]|uniref:Uncharacterized protein n=1 Tax=Eumeta variegata TaxID=151549 RepID=A0A4C1ZF22_EUMVA|nr:hypothetical protein EVAR_61020_1 [Eumeta japonica]